MRYNQKNNQYLNIFTLDNESDLDCYSTYFINPYQICSSYFQNSFDSFLLSDSKIWLVSKDKQQLRKEYFMLYDNSLSKKEFLDESDRDVDITTEVIFSMDNFDDYHSHLLSSSLFLTSVADVRCGHRVPQHHPHVAVVQTIHAQG